MTDSCAKLRVAHSGGVARILIDNAERRNAFDFSMWRALPALLAALDAEEATRIVVLSGAPSLPFCSGADISEFSTVRATAEGGRAYEAANVEAFDALSRLGKPVVAAISGFCMGGGMGLAAACDLRIAAEGAVFGIPAGRLGVGYPPEAMRYVVSAVGAQTAMDLFFTALRIDAEEARAAGFVSRVLPEEGFDAAIDRIAAGIAANAPLTLRAAKAAIRRAAGLPHALSAQECERLAAACFDSADYAEGRNAFLEKREPRFRGG
ncbi:enoyl-CoA hydratase [Methylosinus sp. Sm6]|uniref:enoyl-CoA hydratase n=1 Tax=Methylosinus sp. Sm6 TaxID=2866948 RepID=UPI001C99CE5A|nr:enoyl-CoA hydratase [Methylosinus sp. Sm6]MBY6243613.1 enoyl-CoA hydratase/isomerase family protein [Methylosinus sp. Sm6]